MALDCLINGMTQGFLAPRGYFLTAAAEKQTTELAALGINWVALVVNQFQETVASTRIFDDNRRTIGDRELIAQIDRLHRAGIKVMLKPMLEPLDSIWRGAIRQATGNIIAETTTDTITPWFASYRDFVRRYAQIAQETACEMFCIGCELDGMEGHCPQWQKQLAAARDVYKGLITYNLTMNITEFSANRRWLADLDLVGVSGYYKVGPKDQSSSFADMVKGWQSHKEKLARFAEWLGRPLFFAETGTRPVVGAAGVTGDYNAANARYNDQEQADYYRSMQTSLCSEPWFYGTMWWKWDEHQKRPQYFLPDGHYVGCEPAPATREAMREWCARPPMAKQMLGQGR